MAIKSLDHVNIRTSKARETMNFYTEILGFSDGFRPPFNFPGAWLYAGESAVIHRCSMIASRVIIIIPWTTLLLKLRVIRNPCSVWKVQIGSTAVLMFLLQI